MKSRPTKLVRAIQRMLAAAREVEAEKLRLQRQFDAENKLRLIPVPDDGDHASDKGASDE